METKTYTLEVSGNQLQQISKACELVARLGLGQISDIQEHLPFKKEDVDWSKYHDAIDKFRKEIGSELCHEGYLGIRNSDVTESTRILFDIHDVARNRLSWDRAIEEEMVESRESSRDWTKMTGVHYDAPMKYGNEPLIRIIS